MLSKKKNLNSSDYSSLSFKRIINNFIRKLYRIEGYRITKAMPKTKMYKGLGPVYLTELGS